MTKNKIFIAAAVLIIAALVTVMAARSLFRNLTAEEPKISVEQARTIALQRVQGEIEESELERENGITVYEFEIRGGDGTVREVSVNAINGQIVSDNDDDGDHDDDD